MIQVKGGHFDLFTYESVNSGYVFNSKQSKEYNKNLLKGKVFNDQQVYFKA